MLIEDIKMLTDLSGVSGNEEKVSDYIYNRIKDKCDNIKKDNLGDIIAFKKGKNRPKAKVLFSAHMDEVGFIITGIDADGMLCFSCVGGIQSGVIAGRSVSVGENAIPGIIGAKPVHMLEDDERSKPCKKDNMRIDIGAKSKEEAAKLVSPGDTAVFDSPFERLGKNKILAKAIDDRAGCALLISMTEEDLEYDCTFSFTVQEETGCAGAKAVAYTVQPDIALAVESTTAADLPDTPEEKKVCTQNEGTVISFMDKGTIYTADLYRKAIEWAKENDIKCQSKLGVYGGNESRNLQTAGGGAKTMAVSLPVRYIHSGASVCDLRDIEETRKMLLLLAKKLGEEEV